MHDTYPRIPGSLKHPQAIFAKSEEIKEKSKPQLVSMYINSLFMVALWNRADHYIFMLLFVLSSSSSSSFFLA